VRGTQPGAQLTHTRSPPTHGVSPLLAWGRYTSPVSGQLTGHDTAWSDPLVLTDGQMGTFGAMINLGAMAGACGVGAVADRLGRTRTLALSSVPFMLGCVLAYPRLKHDVKSLV